MEYNLAFKKAAEKDIKRLPPVIRVRVVKILKFFLAQDDPLVFAIPLKGNEKLGSYRFRIGQYRAVFDVVGDTIVILHMGHRREIYRKK